MNLYERELLTDKLNLNLKRQNYLKALLVTCLSIDLVSYVVLESIELAFTKISKKLWFLALYFAKVR